MTRQTALPPTDRQFLLESFLKENFPQYSRQCFPTRPAAKTEKEVDALLSKTANANHRVRLIGVVGHCAHSGNVLLGLPREVRVPDKLVHLRGVRVNYLPPIVVSLN